MDVVFTSLEALILKATQDCLPAPDHAALDALCAVMRDSPDGPALAARALAARVQAGNPHEALLALTALDRCMRRCDASFHSEVGKFRFLNEMIKLVSPKYYAERTAPEVQQRVLQLLHAWTIEYPKETKFKVAFDMLRSQGVVKCTPPPLPPEYGPPPPPRPRAATFEDEEKSKLLQKLLRSNKPEDLQYANKLIKTMVREEERRTEADSRRLLKVRQSIESARLLNSLLEQASDAGEEEKQLMQELEQACRAHHTSLLHLAVSMQSDNLALEEILHAVDELTEVYDKYQTVFASMPAQQPFLHEATSTPTNVTNGADSLLDLAGIGAGKTLQAETTPANKDLVTLGDIFSTENGPTSSMEPLKPVNLLSTDSEAVGGGKEVREGAGLAALDSLGAELLQRSLPGTRLGDSFAGKSAKKIPMNSIEKSSSPTTPPVSQTLDLDFFVNKPNEAPKNRPLPPPTCSATLDDLILDISIDPPPDSDSSSNSMGNTPWQSPLRSPLRSILVTKALMLPNPTLPHPITLNPKQHLSNSTPQPTNTNTDGILTSNDDAVPKSEPLPKTENTPKTPEEEVDREIKLEKNTPSKEKDNTSKVEIRGLSDVEISLASVRASSLPPLTILNEEDGLTVVVHLATNRPRPDVNVLVLSTTSKHTSPISDYKFHAVVPKCCKVRLMAASGTCLPPHSPFLQPAAIIQLMLIARPPDTAVSLKFVVTYTCKDDTVTEMGEVPALPLDQL